MRPDPPEYSDEWVGGHFALDSLVTGEGPPFQPSFVVWVDPAGPYVLIGKAVRPGEEAATLVRLLAEACARPGVGPPRRPARVRVGDELAARRIRERQGIPARVDSVPELEDVRRSLAEYQRGDASERGIPADATFLPAGVSPSEVADLFAHAGQLHALAPWNHIDDEDVLAVDAPALALPRAPLSLIGAGGETLGFVLYESAPAFHAFIALDDLRRGDREHQTLDLGGEILTLTFESADVLPPRMHEEATAHRWVRTGGQLYPVVQRRARDGLPMPATATDLRLAASLAGALVQLFRQNPPRRWPPPRGARSESRPLGGLEVTLTYPHPDVPAAPDDDQAHEMAVIDEVFRFGASRFPDSLEQARKAYGIPDQVDPIELALFMPWFAFCYRPGGEAPLAARFLRQHGKRLDTRARGWLEKQLACPLSVWEVEELRRGEGMTLRDLLTDRRCRVLEKRASEDLRLRDGLLARVAPEDDGDAHRLQGLFPLSLGPRQTAEVIAELARRAGWGALPVGEDVLIASEAAQVLVQLWRDQERAAREAPPPKLCNTDGDPLLLVEDTHDLGGRSRHEVVAALLRAGFDAEDPSGVGPGQAQGESTRLSFSKRKRGGALDIVLVATIQVHDDRLIIETNSRKRATAARRKLDAALGGALPRIRRTETDPAVPGAATAKHREPASATPALPPEALDVVRSFKAQHWKRWLDEPVPALGGVTPRQAARSPGRRAALELLLKEAEHAESSQGAAGFDVSIVRQQLGLV